MVQIIVLSRIQISQQPRKANEISGTISFSDDDYKFGIGNLISICLSMKVVFQLSENNSVE